MGLHRGHGQVQCGADLSVGLPGSDLLWRIGEQVTSGLDPNITVNAWGGPTYLGAMACHYLDAVLIIAVSAWLRDKVLLPAASDHPPVPLAPAANVTTAGTAN